MTAPLLFFLLTCLIHLSMKFKIELILLVLTISAGCNKGQDLSRFDYEYAVPAEFDDGIKTASLKSVGMDTGTTNVLATIIEKESGMSFLDFSNQYLFDALGIKGGKWIIMENGLPMASGGLSLRARELSKIGMLFLNDGTWNGRQILSKSWLGRSVYVHHPGFGTDCRI
jgi:hypothetical protein